MNASNDPLHGKKLADILDELLDYYGGFEGLSRKIEIRCFCIDPSVKSSLRFLRTTPWAREKVESLYLYVLRQKPNKNLSYQNPSPSILISRFLISFIRKLYVHSH